MDSSGGAAAVSEILREALHLPSKNAKLAISLPLLVLLPFSLLVLLHYLATGPLMAEIEDETFSLREHNVGPLIMSEILFLAALALLFVLAMAATVHCSAAAYSGESAEITIRDMISKWKRPAATFLTILLMAAASVTLMAVMVGAFEEMVIDPMEDALTAIAFALETLFLLYWGPIWLLAMVVSVIEDGIYGMAAVSRAGELIRGRRLQGFALMMCLALPSSPIYMIFCVNIVDDELGGLVRFIAGTITTVLISLLNVFTFVVFTVLYYRCKDSGRREVEGEAALRLVSIATGSTLDDSPTP